MINNNDVMTDRELLDAAIELAGKFYQMMGYQHRKGFKYWESYNPQEQLVFEMAIQAFHDLRGIDIHNAIDNLEDEIQPHINLFPLAIEKKLSNKGNSSV
ncbi:hypothetical protein Xekj_00526 [Xenorhabdus sp. KJ12.1]|nr:hypothetical protein Xekj_00526 [Xenorhabdus sp. KJ12.1]